MEENMAILIADLSGYTALTETHGASAAADIIDRYIEIVKDCLAGDSHFHERTGDEVMIVSSSADHLLDTANNLIQYTSDENNFLQVHGGLHYGKILNRNNNYFGTTINLTARIAKKANPGSFWCSQEYINSILHKTPFTFLSKRKQGFKNISEEHEMYELISVERTRIYIDPVCKMQINHKEKATPHPDKSNIFFCHQTCLDIYQRNNLN
jgi:adenylate cyclase